MAFNSARESAYLSGYTHNILAGRYVVYYLSSFEINIWHMTSLFDVFPVELHFQVSPKEASWLRLIFLPHKPNISVPGSQIKHDLNSNNKDVVSRNVPFLRDLGTIVAILT